MWVGTAAISHRASLPSLNPPPTPPSSHFTRSFVQRERKREREREREREGGGGSACSLTLYPQTAAPISGIWVIFSVTHLFSSFSEEGGGKRREEKAVGERLYEGLRD